MTGTLNMADLAVRIPAVAAGDRVLLEAGAAILGIAFLIKAGMWPLCFWLPTTYAAASAPVAALFAILTKVGVYAVLRIWLLFFGEDAGASAGFGGDWLLIGGMVTLAFGIIGVLASQELSRLAGFSLLVSSGTLLAAIGRATRRSPAPRSITSSSRRSGVSAFFLLIELVERGREPGCRRAGGHRGSVRRHRDDGRARGGSRRRHSRDHGASRLELRLLRAGAGGPAAVSRLHRQVRAARRVARPGPGTGGGVGMLVLLTLSGLAAIIAMAAPASASSGRRRSAACRACA